MNKMRYFAFPHYVRIEKRVVKTYGIIAYEKHSRLRIVKDIGVDREAIKHLTDDLNKYQVELIHLDYVIEDFLSCGL